MRLVIKGTVQGVGFRPTVYRVAKSMGLNGYVKNKGSEVEVVIDGDHQRFMNALKDNLPPMAEVTAVDKYQKTWIETGFHIVPSEEGNRSSTIPVDTAICQDCLSELKTPGNRREDFAFINCTNCGARYSTITGLPYDRPKTTMATFPMCDTCREEYENPVDRRFHAQTTSCPDCGPRYVLYHRNKNEVGGVPEFARLMDEGEIAVAKSWGGMHIVCRLESIPELRERYDRPEKPFALMVKDLETARKYAHVTREDVLTGSRRPIMIYPKREEYRELLEHAAPGLPTVGLMLPYTGLHNVLFHMISADVLVMTSANIPGEPMMIRDEEVFGLDLRYFLLHNREIAQRIDDSLIRVHGDDLVPIRRSRGYVPEYLPFINDSQVFGAGADQSGCIVFSVNGQLYPSQYLGDMDSYEASLFYHSTAEHLSGLLGIEEISTVAVDLHPGYHSRKLGLEFAEKYEARKVEVQHHWAHGASLLLEHELDDVVCIAVDGTGYGDDGASWGGEVMYCTPHGYERKAHLEPFPLIGGGEAVKDPRRSVYAIQRMKGSEGSFFNGDTADVFDKLLHNSVRTTSFGRLLDAVSAALDVCRKRTYEGEPAMKLERMQMKGRMTRNYDIHRKGDTVYTLDGFIEMLEDDASPEDRAASYTAGVAYALADKASEAAEETGAPIGISGGVSYNQPVVNCVRNRLKDLGHELLVHKKIPNGDMGVPAGQAVIAAHF